MLLNSNKENCETVVQDLLADLYPGNALAWVQRVHKPADLLDITFCTR